MSDLRYRLIISKTRSGMYSATIKEYPDFHLDSYDVMELMDTAGKKAVEYIKLQSMSDRTFRLPNEHEEKLEVGSIPFYVVVPNYRVSNYEPTTIMLPTVVKDNIDKHVSESPQYTSRSHFIAYACQLLMERDNQLILDLENQIDVASI